MNDVVSEVIPPATKKYTCAGVEAALAEQIQMRAKARRMESGPYLSAILRERFAQEDRGTEHVVEAQASPQAVTQFKNGLVQGFSRGEPPEPPAAPPEPTPPPVDPADLKGFAEVANAILNLRKHGAEPELIKELEMTYRAGLRRLRRRT